MVLDNIIDTYVTMIMAFPRLSTKISEIYRAWGKSSFFPYPLI